MCHRGPIYIPKYKKMAYDHLILQSKLIEDEKTRNDYISLPLLHRLLQEEGISIDSSTEKKTNKEVSSNSSNDELSIFLFCPECGFNNENKFKFCSSCGLSLES